MRRTPLILGLLVLLAGLGYGARTAWIGVPVGLGFAAKMTCSFVFLGDQDADDMLERYVAPEIAPMGTWLTTVAVDRGSRTATASYPGFADRTAVYREGLGCTLAIDQSTVAIAATRPHDPRLGALVERAPAAGMPWPRGRDQPVGPTPPALVEAFERAFAEPGGPARQTTAIAVAYRGSLVAERYAPGFSPQTRMISWSVGKSVVNALVGVAVNRRLFELRAPIGASVWQPGDPRAAISVDQLLRMSSGLAFDEIYRPGSDATHMLYRVADMGAYAASRPLEFAPEEHWSYSSGTTNLVMRILRERLGGLGPLWHFAFTHLFGPIGMTSAVLEPDESGAFVGSSYMWATTRDWLRFGELFRRDGVWQGRNILPKGWVEYSVHPTPAAPRGGYGAQWWLNVGDEAGDRAWPELPPDTYAAQGHSGQYIMILPRHELVIVRLGLGHPGADHGMQELARAVADWVEAGTPVAPAVE